MTSAATQAISSEFEFTDADFERIRRLIYDEAGIKLSPSKRQMVYSRLGRRLRALSLSRFAEYLELLEGGDPVERQAFTNSLTTNLTSFFREPHHFPILAELLLRPGRARPLTIWCAASSTGEEPYSIAMTAMDAFKTAEPPVRILATDVDTSVLEKADAGIYPMERLDRLPEGFGRRFFLKGGGTNAGSAKVRPEVRRLITFRQLNLLEPGWPVRGPFDVVFCRNVMIYFDKPTQQRILERFAPLMRPDGLLFAGHSESFHNAQHLFRLRGKTVYERAPGAGRNHG
jgi:chemotaxis protein methyltransferase CheR